MKQQIVPTSPKSADRPAPDKQINGLFPLLSSVLFGTLAGVFGFFIAANVLTDLPGNDQLRRVFFSTNRREQSIVTQSPEVVNQVVAVYAAEPSLEESAKWIGNAVTLTSDGWLIMPTSLLTPENRRSAVIILTDGSSVHPTRTVDDAWTGLTFLQVAATNLPVVSLNESKRIQVGQAVSVMTKDLSAPVVYERRIASTGFGSQRISSTTERGALPLVDIGAESQPVGSPVFYTAGKLAGILVEEGQLVPSQWITGVFEQVISGQIPQRTSLQLRCVNVSSLTKAERSQKGLSDRGILIMQGDGGLLAGDVVLSINSIGVDDDTDLVDVIYSRPTGTILTLLLLRDEEELLVELIL